MIGNLIVVIVAESKFVDNQVYEYILFSGLLLISTFVFMLLSYFYKYVEDIKDEEDSTSIDSTKNLKKAADEEFKIKIAQGLLNKGKLIANY